MDISISLSDTHYVGSPAPDAISITANWNGFTTLRGYALNPKWKEVLNEEMIQRCNQNEEIIALDVTEPTLFLVPRTKGHGATDKLMADLFSLINKRNIQILKFTHYSCLRGNLPEKEIIGILNFLFNPSLRTTLKKLIWKVDPRAEDEIRDIFFQVNLKFSEKQ